MNSVTSMVAPWATQAPWNCTMLLLRQDRRMATSRQNLFCAGRRQTRLGVEGRRRHISYHMCNIYGNR